MRELWLDCKGDAEDGVVTLQLWLQMFCIAIQSIVAGKNWHSAFQHVGLMSGQRLLSSNLARRPWAGTQAQKYLTLYLQWAKPQPCFPVDSGSLFQCGCNVCLLWVSPEFKFWIDASTVNVHRWCSCVKNFLENLVPVVHNVPCSKLLSSLRLGKEEF